MPVQTPTFSAHGRMVYHAWQAGLLAAVRASRPRKSDTLDPWPNGAHHVAGGAAGGCESLAPAPV
eukprot:8525015-Pyramimonas_sp.AAC.1